MTLMVTQQSFTEEAPSMRSQITSSAESQEQTDLLDQLLLPEVQKSLTILVNDLPKVVEMVSFLTKSYDVAQSLLTDRVLREDLAAGLQEFVKPVEDMVKEIAATAMEASNRAQENSATTIGLFGIFRMLKDPQVQKLFRFVQAYLDVMSEQQKQR